MDLPHTLGRSLHNRLLILISVIIIYKFLTLEFRCCDCNLLKKNFKVVFSTENKKAVIKPPFQKIIDLILSNLS